MIKQDNHYVPHSYLKRWADVDGKVWSYRFLVPHSKAHKWKPHSPKSLGYQKHLYTRIGAAGETDEVERWFDTEFESPAGDALRRATSDQTLSHEDWRNLIRLFAAQDVRTPARLAERMKDWHGTLPALINDVATNAVRKFEGLQREGRALPKTKSPIGAEIFPLRTKIERSPNSSGEGTLYVEATIGRSLWHWSMRHVLTKTLKVLHSHHWVILRSPKGIEWLTSDSPVVRLNYQDWEGNPPIYDALQK